ncbi:MAG: phosphatidylinositol-4-phosphate 5-kinase, partial [Alloprevotella sp.]|nr:phosphatidylinositol-4-phosphate 5-kinase [Alloprevotella sp.]
EKYKGSFKMGKKDGRAIEISAEGTRFDGSYKDGERDGKFTEYDANGNVIRKGEYRNGRLLK